MRYAFTDVFEPATIQRACEAFTRFTGMGTAVLDLAGEVHAAAGWQRICTQFHRVNCETALRCKESDTALANRLRQGQRFNVYRCRNGLVDAAIPLHLEDEHVGNFFTGQFLLEDPDIILFERQAERFGFDRDAYLESLQTVPVFSEAHVEHALTYLVELTELLGQVGLEKHQLLEAERLERERLEAVVARRTAQLARANAELEALNGRLKHLSETDSLTGLYNRAAFDQRLADEWQRMARSGHAVSLLIIDVDLFKQYNDHYGHVAGDQCLVAVAEALKDSMRRPTDFIARYGGEEFACLLSDTDLAGALTVARAIQDNIRAREIAHVRSSVADRLTLSQGVASMNARSDCPAQTLVLQADRSLYEAKQAGRDRIRWVDLTAAVDAP